MPLARAGTRSRPCAIDIAESQLKFRRKIASDLAMRAMFGGKLPVRSPGRVTKGLPVLQVFTYFRPDFTGDGLHFEKLAPFLSNEEISNSVLVLATARGRLVRETNASTHGLSVEYLAQPNFNSLAMSARLAYWAIRHAWKYRVVHFHSHGDRYFLGKIAMRLLGCRIVQSCTLDDSPAELLNSYKRVYRPVVTMLLRVIDLFIAISPRLFNSALIVVPRHRVRCIPQGVALPPPMEQSRDTLRAGLGFAADDVLLLFVGAIVERKGALFLIEMMPRLRRSMPHLKLILVGPVFEDEYGARVTARITELALADCVHIVGYLDDPSLYYRLCDIFVFASHQEGFGHVLIEAMAHRLPVVARLLPDVTDYIIDSGKTGFLFSDADEYCALVERLAADYQLRNSIGNAARAHIEQNFDIAEVAAKYRCAYAFVARERRGS